MQDINVKIKKLDDRIGTSIGVPHYATPGSAGLDLCACIDGEITVKPGEIVKVPTGIAMQIPDVHIAGFIFPRSGLSSKFGISMANCVGVLDSDYTGEIICPVINHSAQPYTIKTGDRIAQLVFMPVCIAKLQFVDTLESTERGAGGFGSTGL